MQSLYWLHPTTVISEKNVWLANYGGGKTMDKKNLILEFHILNLEGLAEQNCKNIIIDIIMHIIFWMQVLRQTILERGNDITTYGEGSGAWGWTRLRTTAPESWLLQGHYSSYEKVRTYLSDRR